MIRETAEQSIAELPSLEAESGIPNASLGIEDAVHYASEGKLILLDVRPEEEFAAGHLPHAVNMPIETLGKRVHELPEAWRSPPTAAVPTASSRTRRQPFSKLRADACR